MNKSALKAAFQSLTFRARIYRAMVDVARRGYSVQHVNNRKGRACLAVRWDRMTGFSFTACNGKQLPVKSVYKLLRAI